jgi:DNA-binding NarL/FixJ family response regulator
VRSYGYVALRCLIVDDNARFCESMRSLLEEEGIAVVGIAASGDEAVRIACEVEPDVALVDIDLGDESGFDVARSLTRAGAHPTRRVILISTHDEREVAELVAASPALGFIAKLDLNADAIRELVARP